MENNRINAWTQWGKLNEVIVGLLPDDACFTPIEPNFVPEINNHDLDEFISWPIGPKPKKMVQLANKELNNLADILKGEQIHVDRVPNDNPRNGPSEASSGTGGERVESKIFDETDETMDSRKIYHKSSINVKRPDLFPCHGNIKTPQWEVPSQSGNACPRDVMITIGNCIIEATMSKRSRYFEFLQFRNIVNDWRERDPLMLHKAAPKPTMCDEMYNTSFWYLSDGDRLKRQHDYDFVITNNEPIFDAADITRVGKDIFVQESMTTNKAGIDWLRRELSNQVRVNSMHFPYDLHPSHIDCTFVPLKPPSGLHGSQGIALYNPERPPIESEMALWHNNNWQLLPVPEPVSDHRPAFSQSSRWLSMNMLSISEKCIVIEENETSMYDFLTDLDFDVITVPFRNVYQFGGSIHCSTWDTVREDSPIDYFPDRSDAYDCPKKFENHENHWDSKIVMPGNTTHPYCNKRLSEDFDFKHDSKIDFQRDKITESFLVEGDHTDSWKTGATVYNDDVLRIDDQPVMESWENPYMRRLADAAASHGGNLLEVGWGLHLSGSRIQEYKHRVIEHHVIEANQQVYDSLCKFAEIENNKDDGSPKVIPHFGMWQDVKVTLTEKYGNSYFDSFLYDPYPQNRESQHTHQFDFIELFKPLLKTNGVFVYCNLTSIGELIIKYDGDFDKMFDIEHRPKLINAGFKNIPYPIKFKLSKETIEKRGSCEYYMSDTCIVPMIINRAC